MNRCSLEVCFFELLQVAIGNRSKLASRLTDEEWASVFRICRKQTLLGVCFAGVQRLPREQVPPITVLAQWLHDAERIRRSNAQLNRQCGEVCRSLEHDGLRSVILKGQSNLVNYPEELAPLRTPGDIDLWAWPAEGRIEVAEQWGKEVTYVPYRGERAVIEYVLMRHRLAGCAMPAVQYHHVDWMYENTEIEVHFRPSWLNCPWHNARLQRWCRSYEGQPMGEYLGFGIPTVDFNVVYQLVHIYRHLFNEGIGLRQLLDYYFVLRRFAAAAVGSGESMGMWDENLGVRKGSKIEVMHTLSTFGMSRFAAAVMWVLLTVFDPAAEGQALSESQDLSDWQVRWPWMLCAPDAKRGRFLLNEIMQAGNFGMYDVRNVISANEGYLQRFARRQKRFLRFLSQYPSEVLWGPYFSIKQRLWRMWHGWR